MANVARNGGFVPVMYANGTPWNGRTTTYLVPSTQSTDIFIGDPVALAGSSGADGAYVYGYPVGGMPTIAHVATPGTTVVCGVVVGFSPIQTNLERQYFEGGDAVARLAYVVDDPNVIFEVEEDADTTPIAAASIGLNATFALGTGSTTTGLSAAVIDSSSVATTNTLHLQVLRKVNRPDNVFYATDSQNVAARFLVRWNIHQFRTGTTGV